MDALNRQSSKNANSRSNAMTNDNATRAYSLTPLPYSTRLNTENNDAKQENEIHTRQSDSTNFTHLAIDLSINASLHHLLACIGALLYRYNQSQHQHIAVFTENLTEDTQAVSDQFITLNLNTTPQTSMTSLQEQARKSLRKLWPRMLAVDSLGEASSKDTLNKQNATHSNTAESSDRLSSDLLKESANVAIVLYQGQPSKQINIPAKVDWLFLWPSTPDPSLNRLVFLAKTALFHPETVKQVPLHLERILLNSQPECPNENLAELSILSSPEKSSLLMRSCHDAKTQSVSSPSLQIHESLPDETDIASYFSHVAQQQKNAPAVVFGNDVLTFEELDQRSTQLAKFLHQKYLSHLAASEKRCAVLLAPHPDVIITLLAILKCGATYIPIDVEFPTERIRALLDASSAKVMISKTEHLNQPTTDSPVVFLDRLAHINSTVAEGSLPKPDANDLCYIFFTSGTTGAPKGVKGSYHNLTFYLQSAIQAFGMSPSTQMPVVARFTFSISLFELLAPIMAGGSVCMLNREDVLHVPTLAKVLTQVTMAHIGPTLLNALITHINTDESSVSLDFTGLHHLSSGGDLVSPTLISRLKNTFSDSELFVVYGCSEIACMGCYYPILNDTSPQNPVIGKGFYQTDVRILDKSGNLLPPYCRGEIYIASPGVTLGYLNLPELTEERYIEKDGKIFYRTGDIGQWLWNGNIEFFGRKDYQVQIKGIRVELAEVEITLKSLPYIKEAAAALQTLPNLSEPVLVGFLVKEESGDNLYASQLREELLSKVPDYLIPSHFVILEKLPVNFNLKVDRRALPIAHTDICLPFSQQELTTSTKVSPNLEKVLSVFQKSTGSNLTYQDANTDFFLLGISSFMLMNFRVAIEKEFGVNLLFPQLKSTFNSLVSIAHHLESASLSLKESKPKLHIEYFKHFFNRSLKYSQVNTQQAIIDSLCIGFDPEGQPHWFTQDQSHQWIMLEDDTATENSSFSTKAIDFVPEGIKHNLELLTPLTSEQMEIWLACQQNTQANAGYNLSFSLDFNHPLQASVLKEALTEISQKNPTLRSRIFEDSQSIGIQERLSLDTILISVTGQDLPSKAILDSNNKPIDHVFFTEAFDLSKEALWRCGWDESQPNQLWFCFHHIIMDGWSINVFFEQFIEIYQYLFESSTHELPTIQPKLLASNNGNDQWWQFTLEAHQDADKTQALEFWKQEYQQIPEPLELPTRWPRGSQRTYNAGYLSIDLTGEPSAHQAVERSVLEQSATKLNVSVFALCYAAFVSLVHRLSGQADFSIGVPLAGQPMLGFPGVMTHSVRTLPLKHTMPQGSLTDVESLTDAKDNSCPDTLTIGEWVTQVAQQLDNAYRHGQCSFGELLSALTLPRDASRPPLLSVVFTQTPDQADYQKGNLTCGVRSVPRVHETFDTWFNVLFNQDKIVFESQFNTDLFDHQTVQGWMQLYKEYLGFFIHQLQASYTSIPSLSHTDKDTIDQWNNTQISFSEPKTISGLLVAQNHKTPEALAFTFKNHSLTFDAFHRKTNQLAHWLQSKGVNKGDSVGVYAERSMEMLLAIYATLKNGALYVPLDPKFPTDRLQYMIENSAIKTAFSHDVVSDQAKKNHSDLLVLNISDESQWQTFSTQSPSVTITPEDDAYIIYTSGSTGRPKGVVNAHEGITNRLLWQLKTHQLSPSDKILFKTPFNFDVSLWEIFSPILNGSQLIIAPPDTHKDPDALEELVVQYGVTMMHFVPSMLSIFLNRPTSVEPKQWPLRAVFCSGEALSPDLQQDFFHRYPDVELHNLYGPTEAAVEVSHWQRTNQSNDKVTPIGKPVANTQLHIVDKYLQPQPIGVAGELLIGGIQVAKGYANQPELTDEKFLPSPFSLESTSEHTQRIYRTGDLARWNYNGDIEYLGRLDFQVKIRGLRIEIGEIETLLNLQAHVKQAVVIVKNGSDGQPHLVAFCTPTGCADLNNEELKQQLQGTLSQTLPHYMVPQVFQFIDEMPLSPSGKADRKKLMGMDVELHSPTQLEGEAPQTPTELFLANLWKELLKIQEDLPRDVEFTELGGHSLLAIQMMTQIKAKFGVKLNFSHVTAPLCEIAKEIDQHSAIEPQNTLTTSAQATTDSAGYLSCALAPEQESVLLASLQSPQASAGYNLSNCFDIRGMLNIQALEGALQTLVNRHQALRTHIDINSLRYQIANEIIFKLDIHNLENSTTDPNSVLVELDSLCLQHASEPFNFSKKQPLTRFKLIRVSAEDHRLLVTLHHTIADGWTKKVFWDELAALYNTGGIAYEAALPEAQRLTDYNAVRHSHEKNLDTSIAFWRSQLSDELDALEFPLYKQSSNEKTFSAQKNLHQFDQKLTHTLHKTAKKLGQTLFNVTLTAYAVLVSRLTQTTPFSIGVPFAGQPLEGMDCLMGQCARVLPVILNVDESLSFEEQIQLTAQKISQIYEHSSITFTELSELADVNNAQLAGNVFSLDQAAQTAAFNELQVTRSENPVLFSIFDLGLTLTASPDQITLEWIFNTQKYHQASVDHWLCLYEHLIRHLIETPDKALSEVSWLPAEDFRKIEALNKTREAYSEYRLFEDIFQWAEAQPDAIALDDGTSQVTYAELRHNVNAIASAMTTNHQDDPRLVAVCMNRTVWVPQVVLAVWLSGGTYLPLDTSAPAKRLQGILLDTEASVVFLDDKTSDHESEPDPELLAWLNEQAISTTTPQKVLNANKGSHSLTAIDSKRTAYLLFTSGSTGKPKGVGVTHDNLWNLLCYLKPVSSINNNDTGLAIANFCFDPSLFELFIPLLSGATCSIAPKHIIQNGLSLGQWINDHNVRFMQATPVIWSLLAENNWQPTLKLKTAISGGDVLSSDIAPIVTAWADGFYNVYGLTETTVLSTLIELDPDRPSIIGQPIANSEALVVDQQGKPLPIGCAGELWIGGKGVAQGYWNKSDITQKAFIERNGKRWYRTGDKARLLPSDELEFLGRIDRQIKLRGFRIEPTEIEQCLLKHEAIEQVCVILHDNHRYHKKAGKSLKNNLSSNQRLVAFVRTAPNFQVTSSALKAHVSRHLPSYLIPQHFEMIEAFPISDSGKVNRKALGNYSLHIGQSQSKNSSVFLTETEQLLADIWSSVLSLDQIDRHDDFFLIGGHSLSAVKVLTKINNQLGTNLSINVFLQNHTLKSLAKLIDSHPEASNQSNAVVLKQGSSTPLFCLYGVLLYKDLANALPENQTVIGVYLKEEMDLLKNEDTETFLRDYGDMSTIAEKYMRTIKSVQPHGPYYISGESFGGVVALEVAQKLKALGDEVALVAMMDSWLPGKAKQRSLLSHGLKHLELAWKDKNYLYDNLLKTKKQLTNWAKQQVFNVKNSVGPLLPFSADLADSDIQQPQKPDIDLRQQARNSLVEHYSAQYYDGTVLLLRAMERDPFEREDVYMGWYNLIPNINVVRVPGDHIGILQKPNVTTMAKHLSVYLPSSHS